MEFAISRQISSDRGVATRSHDDDGLALSASAARSARNTNFRSYTEYMRGVLEGWRPGMRLFVYPCPVLYQPDRACEIAFDAKEVRAVLAHYPGWQRDHATIVAGGA